MYHKWDCKSWYVITWNPPFVWAGHRIEIYTSIIGKWKELRNNHTEKELEGYMTQIIEHYYGKIDFKINFIHRDVYSDKLSSKIEF